MKQIDYDVEQYQNYARGRAVSERQLQIWISGFARMLPRRRPLAGLDVGSGTGRFTAALAQAFGPVTGVEPSARMREIAHTQASHAGVRYAAGSADTVAPGALCPVMVGRDGELAQLKEASRGGQMLVVRGRTGTGESRVAREFAGWARDAGGTVLACRCGPAGGDVPFRPLREALLAAARAGLAPSSRPPSGRLWDRSFLSGQGRAPLPFTTG